MKNILLTAVLILISSVAMATQVRATAEYYTNPNSKTVKSACLMASEAATRSLKAKCELLDETVGAYANVTVEPVLIDEQNGFCVAVAETNCK